MAGNWHSDNDTAALMLVNDVAIQPPAFARAHKDYVADWKAFSDALHSQGVNTASLTETIIKLEEHKGDLEKFIAGQFEFSTADFSEPISEEEKNQFAREYVQSLNAEQLAQAVTHVQSLKLSKGKNGVTVESVTLTPLCDLFDVRAQIFTPKGFIVSDFQSLKHRINVVRKASQLLGFEVVASVPEPLRFSGSDYVPVNANLAFVGVGPHTDEAAIRYLLENNAFGTAKVAVVRDLFDRNDRRKNLDSVFRIVGADVALVAGGILGADNLRRRLVNEYTITGGNFHLTRMGVEFSHYLKDLGFHLIEVPNELHDGVGLPVLNLGLGKLLVADERIAALVKGSPHFKGSIETLTLKNPSSFEALTKSTLLFRKATEGSSTINVGEISAPSHPIWRPADGPEVAGRQTTNCILMVAPIGFQTNLETAADNYFMQSTNASALEIESKALLEFSALHQKLTEAGVTIFLQCSERFHKTPDAVFPNNWFSTHACAEVDGKHSLVAFYPMKTESRRAERRQTIISDMQAAYDKELSFTHWENSDFPEFFESTGVLIMDRVRKVPYIALSQRCSKRVAQEWAKRMGYKLVMFHCTDDKDRPIYHTNVMMSVGTTVAVVCLASVPNEQERKNLVDNLSHTHEIIDITKEQVNQFCGNVLELKGIKDGKERKLMLMSTKAFNGFTKEQKEKMLQHVDELVHADLDTIETIGGGGARCMMGEIF